MKLAELILCLGENLPTEFLQTDITSIEFDSRKVTPGALFVAVVGEATDGHSYIAKAVENGAAAVVCQQLPDECAANVCYVKVSDSHAALGHLASAFYGDPSRQLTLVGVTGTNGKTTTATLLYSIFRAAGYGVGLISTVEYRIDDRVMPSTHTTPDAVTLNRLLAEMVAAGCSYCFMEVSSHSLVQRRVESLHFRGAIFTNITHDHLDYHKTFAEYIRAKKLLFDGLSPEAFALVNNDDKNGMTMVQNTRAKVFTYSLRSVSDYKCKIVEELFDGMLLNIDGSEVWVNFIGGFNAYNLLGVYATARQLGLEKEELLRIMSGLRSVRGRFEHFNGTNGVTAIVDYAHTPDALQNVIDTINDLRYDGQKLYVVAGCGGDRDRTKRPEMARIAVQGSDLAILTSDNPRTENPEEILDEMCTGLDGSKRYLRITDRRQAIITAATLAQKGDIILVAGKGHETYQEIHGIRHHFDDMEELRKVL